MLSNEFLAFQNGPLFVPKHDFKNDPGAIAQYRKDLDMNTLPGGVLPEGISTEEEYLGGVRCEWIRFADADPEKLVIQIHGGGFAAGLPCTKQWASIRVGLEAKANMLSIDYRLAPEHPYPAALMDCVSVYRAVLQEKGYQPEQIVFLGESAGATLCLTTALYAKDHGLPVPKALAVASPCANAGLSAEERKKNAPNDPLLEETDELMQYYISDADPSNPYLSPAFADFTGMPSILLQAGTDEMLGTDAVLILQQCIAANVDIRVHSWASMGHVFFLQAGLYPEADAGLAEIISFVHEMLK